VVGASKVVFEFLGGPRDGERLCGCLVSGAYTEAEAIFRRTERAQIGQSFWCTCEYSRTALRTMPAEHIECLEATGHRFRGHIYEIVLRWERPEELLIRAKHVRAAE